LIRNTAAFSTSQKTAARAKKARTAWNQIHILPEDLDLDPDPYILLRFNDFFPPEKPPSGVIMMPASLP